MCPTGDTMQGVYPDMCAFAADHTETETVIVPDDVLRRLDHAPYMEYDGYKNHEIPEYAQEVAKEYYSDAMFPPSAAWGAQRCAGDFFLLNLCK
jgi:hypothetical protein